MPPSALAAVEVLDHDAGDEHDREGRERTIGDADFLVVEEASYTTELTRQAREAGLGMFVWTVNTDTGIRQALRDGVEGIISDHGDVALTSRDEMDDETGMSGVLYDAIFRFVKIF